MHTKITILSFVLFAMVSCKNESKKEGTQTWRTKKMALENETHNQLLDVEKEQGWELLFDGKTLNGWHLYNNPGANSVWEVVDGELHSNANDESLTAGDLLTDKPYTNYELTLEWKISSRGNSGIFINVQENPEIPTAWQTGPEYQILDSEHMDYNLPEKRPGCLYVFAPQKNAVEMKPGEWNTARIKQVDGKVEFYLNGVLTGEQDFNDPEWKKMIAATHFSKYAEFGKATQGRIALQYWYFETWFRDIKIKEL
ncbi:3-keto-disaccharide hydrolase [Flagellimonas aequoris]|uniref:DUF1080 domain-containing protein n=1 Tax=Flagellimonas aequoris TaxID=2306997 RepID=A0A418N923_9FLAO|nr:DUF1080 domain-containing protein [Allomuricauda aequoris]RIV72101.1 DUF1080 domain-containing protein [Allomuricauda aequoris]TXK03874.1 DUF1080 domain-containing protein [Allomuricauda aequoris]